MEEKLIFRAEDGTDQEFFVLEETRINGVNYLLVADSEEEEAQCLILRDVSGEEEAEAVYEPVEDDAQLQSLSKVFSELLGDVEIR